VSDTTPQQYTESRRTVSKTIYSDRIVYEIPLKKLPGSNKQPLLIIEWSEPTTDRDGRMVTRFKHDAD
jgi:hypothetical protein